MIDSAVSEDAILARLRAWVKDVTGLDDGHVIKDHPGAPRPRGPYVMLNILSADRVAEMGCRLYEHPAGDEEDEGESGGPDAGPMVERRATDWEWVVSVNVYAPSALDTARNLSSSTRSPAVMSRNVRPMVFRETSMLRRIPELVEGSWEGRAQFDVTVAACVLDGFLVDIIERGTVRLVAMPSEREVVAEYEKAGD